MASNQLNKGRCSTPGHAYFVTACTYHKCRFFKDFFLARLLVRELVRQSRSGAIELLCWVIMPDHFHALFILQQGSISDVMNSVKGRSARYINKSLKRRGKIWQSGFYEHALHDDEDIKQIARYIVANPLRARLTDSVKRYPLWDAVWV